MAQSLSHMKDKNLELVSDLSNKQLDSITLSASGKNLDADGFSPIVLAYIGDAVFEVIIRRFVMAHGNVSANKMHKITSSYVSAASQAAIIKQLYDVLTEEELLVFKRGRNAKSGSVAKNQSMSDYRHATGFESLIGYLYLKHREDRIYELLENVIHWQYQ